MGGKKVCAWLLANCEVQLCSALAAVSLLGVVVMCPMMLDPSIDTLVSSFDEGMCQTVYHQFLRGISNCTWTSCREGCTAEVYSCYHLIVVYVKGTAEDLEAYHKTRASANQLPHTVRLDGKAKGEDIARKNKALNTKSNSGSSSSQSRIGNSNNNNKSNQNNNAKTNVKEEDEISADIIESILGESINDSRTTASLSLLTSSPPPPRLPSDVTTTELVRKIGAIQHHENGVELEDEPIWIIPPDHDLQVYEYNNTFIRDLDANLALMMSQIRHNLEIDSYWKYWRDGEGFEDANTNDFLPANLSMLGIGALLPNIKGCVYPSEIACSDFLKKYGRVGGPVFPCFISKFNSSTVVVTVDKAAAVRHIFYSFIPLVIASGVFTYLFYRVGLIGSKGRRKPGDEEAGDEEAQRRQRERERLQNGQPPVVRKKVRKKFLPNRDSSKKRRKGKIFNKNKLLSVKQLSIKSPSSSRRTPSMSIGAISDDGFSSGGGGNPYNNRTSVQLM